MSAHLSEELPRLLTGDATRDEVLAAAEHLRGCPDCQQELVSAVVAHAALTSAHRFAADVVSHDAPTPTEPPPGPLPDLTEMFAQVRTEASRPAPVRGRRRLMLLGAAAAVVLALGGGLTLAETLGSSSSPSSRTIQLAAYGVGDHAAKATLIGNATMRIDASTLPRLDAEHFYEIWLTDKARTHMQSLGPMGSGNQTQLTISPKVMAQYSDIEVSVQRTNQPAYSGTSVLRGGYAS